MIELVKYGKLKLENYFIL